MWVRFTAAFGALLALACVGPTPRPAEDPGPSPRSDELPRAGESVLYAIGFALGTQVEAYALDEAETREVARGMIDASLRRPYAKAQSEDLAAQIGEFHERRLKALARREEIAGAAVLERAASAEGAVKTDTGMILTVLEPGTGAPPSIFDFVRITFHGTLREGTVFHTNRGEDPYRVQLGTTLRCWQQALGAVSPGARLHVVCPPDLGYGWAGWPGRVPGGSVLSFELELIEVIPTPPPPQ